MHEMLPAFQGSPRGTGEEGAPSLVTPGFKSHASQSASRSAEFSQLTLSVLGAAGVVSPSGLDDTVCVITPAGQSQHLALATAAPLPAGGRLDGSVGG